MMLFNTAATYFQISHMQYQPLQALKNAFIKKDFSIAESSNSLPKKMKINE